MSLQGPPYLLPQNRKLRHLRGIYLRNLTFSRPRGHTIDDANLNKSPAKLAALRLRPSIPHARSSDDLRADSKGAGGRRGTLTGGTAATSQRVAELALDNNSADVFFSLHCDGVDEPVYVSEVEKKAAHFNFRFFDLGDRDQRLLRSAQLTVKVWACRTGGTWSLLVEDVVDLRFLGFLGSLQGAHFPPNCIVFHLVDGIYIFGPNNPKVAPKPGPALPTSSYTALMRLANLENSIQDSLATQDRLALQINERLAREAPPALPDAEARIRRVAKGLAHQKRLAEAAQRKRADIAASIEARRAAIEAGLALQKKAQEDVAHAAEKLASSRATTLQTMDGIRGQRRRVCEDLIRIFAIVPTATALPLSFQICGLPLPNTDYGPALAAGALSEDTLSAALGYVALLAQALQGYLCVALPYPVTACGSRSVIRDDISKLPDAQREFPLHLPRGGLSSQYRFDYAWFLLNKDIEALCCAQGLKVVDIRHTLPNLKYLLYVCSAGSDDLPQRKQGGVRGLWARHHLQQQQQQQHKRPGSVDSGTVSTTSSRRGSVESVRQRLGNLFQNASVDKDQDASSLALPFDESTTTLTLRTKGLRENAGR